MATSPVVLDIPEPGIGIVLMQDPVGKNALSEPFVEALCTCFDQIRDDPGLKVCLLRGLPDVFCSGAPLSLLVSLAEGQVLPTDIVLSEQLLDLPVPMIAAMEGHAVGGGLALGLCCDMVLVSRESRYGCSFMNMGFTPGMGITGLLEEALGPYLAREMMLSGEFVKGSRLQGRGNLNDVLPRAEVWPRAMSLARRLSEKPRFALELLKRNLSIDRRRRFQTAKTLEAQMHQVCFAHPETLDMIKKSYILAAEEGERGTSGEGRSMKNSIKK